MLKADRLIKATDTAVSYWHIALIVIVAFCCYSNTFSVPFIFDDIPAIVENQTIRDLGAFLTSTSSINPRSAGYLSFALDYKFHGYSLFGYHLTNLFIHTVNGILIFCLASLICSFFNGARTLGNRNISQDKFVPTLAALLFVCHPVQIQAVTYIVQRFTSLAVFFTLLAVILYIYSHQHLSKRRGRHFRLLSLAATILAMFTKEFAIVLPIILGAWEFLFGTGKNREKAIRMLPFLCTTAIIPITMFRHKLSILFSFNLTGIQETLQQSVAISTSKPAFTAMEYFFTQCRVFLTYLRLLFWPSGQNLDYDYPIYRDFWMWEVALPFTLVLGIIITSLWLVNRSKHFAPEKRAHILVFVFLLWSFFISFIPESTILPIKDVIFEHRLYFPSIWFFILSALLIKQTIDKFFAAKHQRRTAGVAICLLLSTCLASATWARNQVWGDGVSLWQDTVGKSPYKFRPRKNLVVWLNKQDRYAESLEVLKSKDLRDTSTYASHMTHVLLSETYLGLGSNRLAIDETLLALEVQPNDAERLSDLGALYSDIGDFSRGTIALNKAAAIEPDRAEIHYNLGRLYSQQGQINLAEQSYKKAISLRNDYEEAFYNLGTIYSQKGNYPLAEQNFLAAIQVNPGLVPAYNNLVVSLAGQGRISEAKQWCQKALSISPKDQTANSNWKKLSRL